VKPRDPSAANNVPGNSSASESARSSRPSDDDSTESGEDAAENSSLLRRGAHHIRRGLSRAGVPQIAGHAARLGGHGWRRISSAVGAANSGGRLSRPVGALWGRVARRPSGTNGPAGDNPHGHRNRRLAFDFAVVASALAIVLILHHQFRRSPHPRVAELVAATDVAPEQASQQPQPMSTHHRRRTHKPALPAAPADARPIESSHADPIAPADDHKVADRGADFGDHRDVGRHDDHHDVARVDVVVKAPPKDNPPHDAKHTADAALENLLSTPIDSGAPHHAETAAPVAQTEPAPSSDLDKHDHPHHSSDPLLVDSRDPGPSATPEKRERLTQSAGTPRVADDFAAPDLGKPHEHHEPKDHGPKDPGPKDEFAMPAPSSPLDSPPAREDSDQHKHHHADHGQTDRPDRGDLPTSHDRAIPPAGKDDDLLAPKLDGGTTAKASSLPADAPRGNDPLLDVGPKLDGPQKDAAADKPTKSSDDKFATHKSDHPDEGLPVLSVPSPHKNDEKLRDDLPKSDGPKIDDLGPPTRTANASDATLGGSPADSSKNLPPKPPEDKPPAANDASLDELLNSKAPAAKPSSSSTSSASPNPQSAPAASPKDDPFHTDVAPHGDAGQKTDPGLKIESAPKVDSAPKMDSGPKVDSVPKVEVLPKTEPAPKQVDTSLPAAKSPAEPLHAIVEEESMSSVAVAHHQIEKDASGASLRYKIVVRNNGKKAVKLFEVEEAVPAEHTVQLTDPPAETRDQDLHWTLRDVGPGEERTIVVTLVPPARPVERSLAAPEPAVALQTIPAAAVAHDAGSGESPQLKLELIAPVEVHAGESCRIGFRATNLGGKTTDLKLNLDLPGQLRYTRGQQLQYKIGALGDHEAREDYLTATAAGSGQVELRAEILHAGHSVATAKGTCRVSPAGAPHRGVQQTGAWGPTPSSAPQPANAADCLCWP
jgi:hypothetical protein